MLSIYTRLSHIGLDLVQYVQGNVGRSNIMEEELTIYGLYIGLADNNSGHSLFKLSTKETVSENRVAEIHMF